MERWYALYAALPIIGGLLACAGVIVKNAPAAKVLFNKLLPFKALVGVGLLGSFFVSLVDVGWNPLKGFDLSLLFGLMVLTNLVTQLILGFTMGFGQIAKWIPGDTDPEEAAEALQRKLMPYEVTLGLVAIVSGGLGLLYGLRPEYFY